MAARDCVCVCGCMCVNSNTMLDLEMVDQVKNAGVYYSEIHINRVY